MALKVYTTFLHEWTYGEADPISVHLTERAQNAALLIIYIYHFVGHV